MSQSSYLLPLLWLKKEANKEEMSATQCQIFFFYYQMFELLFARERFAFWSFPLSKKLGGKRDSQG